LASEEVGLSYLVAVAAIFGVNLLPAFGPPTWSVMVLFRLHSHINAVVLVVFGALAAALGRYVLARACRRLRGRLSAKRSANLATARQRLTANRTRSVLGLALFALSPVPSAQLFEAAGLMDLPLAPLVAVFFAGRLVSYSIYVAGASALKSAGMGRLFTSSLTNPWGVALEVAMLAGIVALGHVDWTSRLARRHDHV
jgi:membrane protein YqaA with SNARE-associated domain